MAYIFKVILRAENHEFYYIQNKINSANSSIAVCKRGTQDFIGNDLFNIRNKDGKIKVINEDAYKLFKQETLQKIKTIINSWYGNDNTVC